jgi:autotransporter-associated beta strand protein
VGNQLWIGGSADTGDQDVGLGGLIGGAYVYNYALTQPEIQWLYSPGGQVLPTNTPVTLASGATLDVGGLTQTIGSLTGPSGSSVVLADTNTATGTLTVGNGSNTVFAGTISGAGSLTVAGADSLTLSGANTYSGATVVSSGTLAVNNTSGSATGSGNVTVQTGGTLEGNGAVAGSVTVATGGTLEPGNPLGNLTVGNNLTLAAGSATLFQVQHSPLANSGVIVSGSLFEGGSLFVNSASQLAQGDTFNLFTSGSFNNAFTNVVLAVLPVGLGWDTTNLDSAGVVSVVINTQPVLALISVSTAGMVFTGTGGVGDGTFYLLASPDLTAPVSNWTAVYTGQFDGYGNFNFTNAPGTNGQMFYLIQVP